MNHYEIENIDDILIEEVKSVCGKMSDAEVEDFYEKNADTLKDHLMTDFESTLDELDEKILFSERKTLHLFVKSFVNDLQEGVQN